MACGQLEFSSLSFDIRSYHPLPLIISLDCTESPHAADEFKFLPVDQHWFVHV